MRMIEWSARARPAVWCSHWLVCLCRLVGWICVWRSLKTWFPPDQSGITAHLFHNAVLLPRSRCCRCQGETRCPAESLANLVLWSTLKILLFLKKKGCIESPLFSGISWTLSAPAWYLWSAHPFFPLHCCSVLFMFRASWVCLLQVQRGFRSVVVYLTALDSSCDFLAVGSSIGMLYLYCRRLAHMNKYSLEVRALLLVVFASVSL